MYFFFSYSFRPPLMIKMLQIVFLLQPTHNNMNAHQLIACSIKLADVVLSYASLVYLIS